MYYRNVKIERDRMTSVTKLVPSHEVPVLKRVFDPESVREQPGFIVTDRPYPSIADEYRRLIFVYGEEAVREAYPTEADMAKEIPLLAKVATAVVSFKLPRFGRQERADIPPPPDTCWPAKSVDGKTGSVDEGMLQAINDSLRWCDKHAEERERFKT